MAVPNAALVVVALRRGRYTGLVGIAVGTAMVAWIVLELAFIRELSFFHPLYVTIGLLMVWLGFRLVRVPPRKTPREDGRADGTFDPGSRDLGACRSDRGADGMGVKPNPPKEQS